jgi:hypothetical protein
MAPIGFALQVGISTGAEWRTRARRAEDCGFETLGVADRSGITASPFVALAAAGAVTSRIRLATAVADRVLASERFLDVLPAPIQRSGVPNAEAAARVPFVMIGSISEIVEELLRRRERWGFTRYTVRWSHFESLAPVMRRLEELGELAT